MLDAASASFIAELAASGLSAMHQLSPTEARQAGKRMIEIYGEGPEMERTQDLEIDASDGGRIGLRLLVPAGRKTGVIVY
jgi:acetyl esterase